MSRCIFRSTQRGASVAVAITLLSHGATPLLAQPTLSLDAVANSASITGSVPSAVTWSPTGRQLAFLWDSAGRGREVWVVNADGSGRRALRSTESGAAPPRELFYAADPAQLYVVRGDSLQVVTVSSGAVRTLALIGRDAHDVHPSPDGTRAAFLRDGDLWLVSLAGGATPTRVTTVGLPSISPVGLGTYARLDREIGSATWASAAPSFAWSPDGRTIAVHLVDRRNVRRVPFPYYLGAETVANEIRRAYPGDDNEVRQVALLDVARGTLTPLPFDLPTSVQVLNYAWSQTGTLFVDRERDDATERWVHVLTPGAADAAAAAPRLVYHDRRASRIYTEHASTWDETGAALLLTTDRDDRYRVYRVGLRDTTPVPLTPASGDVQGEAMPTRGRGLAWISNDGRPSERHLWRQQGRAAPQQITQRAGTHRVWLSPDGRHAASLFSTDVTPPQLLLVDVTTRQEREVTPAGGPMLARAALVAPQYVRFAGADEGDTLHAKVWLPAAAKRGERVPIVFGPLYSNTVRNRWGGTYGLLQQHLLQRGYAVMQVDVRGSTGYGRAFREAFLFEWGGRDLDDLAATKRWLGAQAWADTSRTGIFGSSYGGLITVYALFTRPGLFKAGVAGASAVDPRFFGSDDVAIARRPDTHPEVFARRALRSAGGLRDRLMLIHGLMDDVVPFKTIADLTEELVRQGKDFDLVVSPSATHGWTARPPTARYLLGKLVQHLDRALQPDTSATSAGTR